MEAKELKEKIINTPHWRETVFAIQSSKGKITAMIGDPAGLPDIHNGKLGIAYYNSMLNFFYGDDIAIDTITGIMPAKAYRSKEEVE